MLDSGETGRDQEQEALINQDSILVGEIVER